MNRKTVMAQNLKLEGFQIGVTTGTQGFGGTSEPTRNKMAQSKGATAAGMRGTTHVSFVCQRCYQPLRLDHSFNSFDAETLKELTGKAFLFKDFRPIIANVMTM